MWSVLGAGGDGIVGDPHAVSGGEVGEASNAVVHVPHVAVVGVVVVERRGLALGLRLDLAGAVGGRDELEELVVDVLLDGGSPGAPDANVGVVLDDCVETTGWASRAPSLHFGEELLVEGSAVGVEGGAHLAASVGGVHLGESITRSVS